MGLLTGCQATMSQDNQALLEPVQSRLLRAEADPEQVENGGEALLTARQFFDRAVELAMQTRIQAPIRHNLALSEQYLLVADEQVKLHQLEQSYEQQHASLILLSRLGGERSERGLRVVLSELRFEQEAVVLDSNLQQVLQDMALLLSRQPTRRLMIEGYTDSVGTAQRNRRLSRQRAEAVAEALHKLGVPREQMRSVGYGEAFPIASNQNPLGRELNRRIELLIGAQERQFPPERLP